MCRIVGAISLGSNKISIDNFIQMRDVMTPGGPDAEGIWVDESGSVALGHRRLSILDLSDAGNQPMHSTSNRYVCSYNGEVYNFIEIRSELESLGYVFHTSCDTEVILAAFEEYGIKCANLFHGMFAIALWDRHLRTLTLIRDRVGVKPLYFYLKNNYFIFASELKAIVKFEKFEKSVSKVGLSQYFKYGYIPTPLTIFNDCMKLEAGHFLILNENGKFDINRWWKPNTNKYAEFDWNNEKAVIDETKKCLCESFEKRLVSDVDVGLFLSGGVDSGLLASILTKDYDKKLNTFTVGFSNARYDESSAASYLAHELGTNHHSTELHVDECKELIPQIYKVWDEPFADTSTISTYLVCQFAAKHVKVSLSADGGDELFGGYPKHWLTLERAQQLQKVAWSKGLIQIFPDRFLEAFRNIGVGNRLLKAKEILNASNSDNLLLNTFIIGQHIYTDFQLSQLLGQELQKTCEFTAIKNEPFFSELDSINQLLYTDLTTYHVDDIHFKVDRSVYGSFAGSS